MITDLLKQFISLEKTDKREAYRLLNHEIKDWHAEQFPHNHIKCARMRYNYSPEIPYISILIPLITNSPTRGFYIETFFDRVRARIVLAMTVGYLGIRNQVFTDQDAYTIAEKRVKVLQSKLPKSLKNKYHTEMKLGAQNPLGKGYAHCTILCQDFQIETITDSLYTERLHKLYQIYEILVGGETTY